MTDLGLFPQLSQETLRCHNETLVSGCTYGVAIGVRAGDFKRELASVGSGLPCGAGDGFSDGRCLDVLHAHRYADCSVCGCETLCGNCHGSIFHPSYHYRRSEDGQRAGAYVFGCVVRSDGESLFDSKVVHNQYELSPGLLTGSAVNEKSVRADRSAPDTRVLVWTLKRWSVFQLGADELAVQACDVAERYVLRAFCGTCAGVGAVAEAEFVHLAEHGFHATCGFYLALRE